MARSVHFRTVADWTEAAALVDFVPRRPRFTAGFRRSSLAVHVLDHHTRPLPIGRRSVEAHYGGFVVSQQRAASPPAATRMALSTAYGSVATTVWVAGYEGRSYPLGPEPHPDDLDGRSPAVVVWAEDDRFYLVASDRLDEPVLLRVAASLQEEAPGV